MFDPWAPSPNANLLANARLHRRDDVLERLLALRDSDPDRYAALPNQAQSQVEVYADLRDHHDRAVELGLIEGEASCPRPSRPIDTAELEQRAARAAELAAEASAAVAQQHAEADRRQRERQAAYDRKLVDAYDRRALDEAVDRCRADLERTVAESPITQAAARLLAAEVSRYVGHHDLIGALDRLGRPTAGAQSPPTGTTPDVASLLSATAERLAHDDHEQHLERTHRALAEPTGGTT